MVDADHRNDTSGSSALELARAYVAMGLRPFPVPRGSKKFDGTAVRSGWATMAASAPSDAMLRLWFPAGRELNIGIGCRGSGLAVIDEDTDGEFARLCAALGHDVPQTFRVSTSPGRWQHWFRDPIGDVVNRTDVAGYDIDVRGPGGDNAGGYVIAPGSVHPDGHEYIAVDPGADIVVLPPWLRRWIDTAPSSAEVARAASPGTPARDPDDREFTRDQAAEYIRVYAIEPLERAQTGHRNHALNAAALVLGHFGVGFGFTYDQARERLMAVPTVEKLAADDGWDSVADTIDSGWRRGISEPYTRVADTVSDLRQGEIPRSTPQSDITLSAQDDGAELAQGEIRTGAPPSTVLDDDPAEVAARIRARKLAEEIERQEIRAEAMRTVALERVPELRALNLGEFLDSPVPEWLVPGFLYRASTAKVYGPPGGTKSFALLDVALSLAAGRPWHGRGLDRMPVHYLMAEGQAVNALRARAWLAHHGVDRAELDGMFTAVPQGVLLTPEGIARYLELAARDKPGLVILDTKNRMMLGEENSASDVAVMVRAMDAIREASGANVTLVDHTGLTDTTRGRGSNAVTAAMDSEVRVTFADGVGTAEVTRDKAGETGLTVSYRLQAVPEVPRPHGIAAPAVCVPTTAQPASSKFSTQTPWWDLNSWPLPGDVLDYRGRGSAAVAHTALYMRYAAADNSGPGVSRLECRKAVQAVAPGKYSVDTLDRAWDALLTATEGPKRLSPATTNPTGRSHWRRAQGDPEPFSAPVRNMIENAD
jgi:hypothetical protein